MFQRVWDKMFQTKNLLFQTVWNLIVLKLTLGGFLAKKPPPGAPENPSAPSPHASPGAQEGLGKAARLGKPRLV